MTSLDWLTIIGLGGLLGAVGQGARAIVGLKKASDAATGRGERLKDTFDAAQLVVSLMIGFVAGTLATIAAAAAGNISTGDIEGQTLAMLVAAGYAGTDFIEGFMTRATNGSSPRDPQALPPALG
jgi:hypothetical protein